MKISVKGYWTFKRFIQLDNGLEIEMAEGTLADALAAVVSEVGEELYRVLFDEHSQKMKGSNLILLNGQNYLNLARKMSTPMKDGDEIALLPMVTGG